MNGIIHIKHFNKFNFFYSRDNGIRPARYQFATLVLKHICVRSNPISEEACSPSLSGASSNRLPSFLFLFFF